MTTSYDPLPPARLIWIDIEFSGTNPDVDHILEIYAAATDADLNILHEDLQILCRPDGWDPGSMSPEVYKMHKGSGLLHELDSVTVSEADAQTIALEWINNSFGESTLVHCGYFVELDRLFIAEKLPELWQRLGYRSLDLRSLEEAADAWTEKGRIKRAPRQHRAGQDVNDAIQLAGLYRNHIFGGLKQRSS